MTSVIIDDILPYTQTICVGSQSVFSTDWTANYSTDVLVFLTPSGDEPDDVTQLLDPSDYNVAFIGSGNIVEVTLVTPASTGDAVTIIRNTPADRQNLYTNTNFTPSMLNNDFSILTLVDQQAQLVNQLVAPRYNYSAEIIPVIDTILPVLSANQVWAKNSNNTAIVPYNLPSPGQYVSSQILAASGVNLTNSVSTNITSITLTPGTWNVWGNVLFNPNPLTSIVEIYGWISSISSTMPDVSFTSAIGYAPASILNQVIGFCVPGREFSVSVTTTIYLSVFAAFTLNTMTGSGGLFARMINNL